MVSSTNILALAAVLICLSPRPDDRSAIATRRLETMVGVYQQLETYQARWRITDRSGPVPERHTIEIAFDRTTDHLLIRRQAFRFDVDRWIAMPVGELLVSDGREIRSASRDDPHAPWLQFRLDVPEERLRYQTLQRLLSHASLDLPLLLGEEPMGCWLQESAAVVTELPEDRSRLPGFKLNGSNISISARVDPRSNLLMKAICLAIGTRLGAEIGGEHRLESVRVGEPIEADVFQFSRQLDNLDPGSTI